MQTMNSTQQTETFIAVRAMAANKALLETCAVLRMVLHERVWDDEKGDVHVRCTKLNECVPYALGEKGFYVRSCDWAGLVAIADNSHLFSIAQYP